MEMQTNERGKLYNELHRNRGAGKPVVENHWELKFRLEFSNVLFPPRQRSLLPPYTSQLLLSSRTQLKWYLPLDRSAAYSSCAPWLPITLQFSSVQFSLSVVSDSPWTAAHQASLSITNSWSLLSLMAIESVRPSNHLILCHSLLLPPSVFPSIRVFLSESALPIRWPKYWSFSFSFSMFQHQSFQ